MVSSKRIGFFWGEEKVTLVEFEKNAPLQVVSSPIELQIDTSSTFSSNFTEEIQITAIFQKMLRDNRITGCPFYVSLPCQYNKSEFLVISYASSMTFHPILSAMAKTVSFKSP